MSVNKGYYSNIAFESLSENEYTNLKDEGMLYVYYPEATGDYYTDVVTAPNKAGSRIDAIGQNGNDGGHYNNKHVEWCEVEEGNPCVHYRVPMSDNSNSIIPEDWPHIMGDSYNDKVKKTIEDTYEPLKDDMFVDDYEPVPLGVDAVRSPLSPSKHYGLEGIGVEAIDVIEAVLGSQEASEWLTPKQGVYYGNVLSYMLRAPKRNASEDILEALDYLTWLAIDLGVKE